MRRQIILLAAAMSIAALAVSGCRSAVPDPTFDGSTGQMPVEAKPRVVFDMAHGEVFGADDNSELGQSEAVRHMLDLGMDVEVNRSKFTTQTVDGAAGIILAGPMQLPTFEEQALLERYVASGGFLVITTHVAYPILTLPERYGLELVPTVITSDDPLPGMDRGTFKTTNVEADALTDGVREIVVLSSWGVDATSGEADIVISSETDTWVDSDGDRERTDADATGPFGLVAVSRYGRGTVVLIGDDAVFANAALGQADNVRLFDNILRLMGARAFET